MVAQSARRRRRDVRLDRRLGVAESRRRRRRRQKGLAVPARPDPSGSRRTRGPAGGQSASAPQPRADSLAHRATRSWNATDRTRKPSPTGPAGQGRTTRAPTTAHRRGSDCGRDLRRPTGRPGRTSTRARSALLARRRRMQRHMHMHPHRCRHIHMHRHITLHGAVNTPRPDRAARVHRGTPSSSPPRFHTGWSRRSPASGSDRWSKASAGSRPKTPPERSRW